MYTWGMSETKSDVLGRCQHCNVQIFWNPDGDPRLDSMAHLCWKCVKPHGVQGPWNG